MAFSNGWRYGAPIPPGPVTRDDLYDIIPVNPPGQRVQEIFSQAERIWPDKEYDAAFVTSQGVSLSYGTGRQALDFSAVEALTRYSHDSWRNPVESSLLNSVVLV